jgi:hypothetical protein
VLFIHASSLSIVGLQKSDGDHQYVIRDTLTTDLC